MNFVKVYDLQNSSRTSFYKRILFPKADHNVWSSSVTTIPKDKTKEEFDKYSVLQRFEYQLKCSGLKTKFTTKPDFSWSCSDIANIKSKFNLNEYILLFPFCSPHLKLKQWPYFNELIEIIKKKHEQFVFFTAPAPSEISMSSEINATPILNNKRALNIMEVAGLIKKSSFIIANDTGPAHMTAHLNMNGIVLFGHHTTAKKVSIETDKFKAIQVDDLSKLSAEQVYKQILDRLV